MNSEMYLSRLSVYFNFLRSMYASLLMLALVNASLKSFSRLIQRLSSVSAMGGTLVFVLSNNRLSWSSFQPLVWSPSRYIRKV